MSKRGAGDQLTRENYSNNSDEEELKHNNIMASSEVMNKRKIAMPKRKMVFSNKTTSSAAKDESSFANAFNFSKKTKPSTSANEDEKPAKLKALNEQFKSKIITVLASDACSDLSSLFSKYSQYINQINGTANQKKDGPPATFTASFASESKPVESVKPVETKLPSSGFNFTLNKSSPATPEIAIPPVKKQEAKPAAPSSESESESEDEIKVEGPKFTINTAPIKSDSVFSFGPKKVVPKDDSDSESDIEIKGPAFTFSGSVKSDVFKLKPNEKQAEPVEKSNNIFNIGQEKKPDEKMTPSFSFGIKKTEENNDNEPKEKPAFAFGQSSTTPVTKPSFGASFSKPMETSTNDTSETKTPTSAFSFNKPAETKETEATPAKPTSAFNFLSKQASTSDDNKEEKKSTFSFAPASNSNTTATPSFSFGAKPTETITDKPVFGLASSTQTDDKKENETPVSAFGQSVTTKEEKKPAFTFGQANSTSKPSFNFGQTKDAETKDSNKPSFTFSKPVASNDTEKTDAKPSFSFGQPTTSTSTTEEKSVSKPSFSFGQPTATSAITTDKTDSKPSFSFGINSSSAPAPSFNFGKPADNSKTSSTSASGGFKFSLPFEQKTTPATTEAGKNEDDKTEAQPKQDITDNEPKDDIADNESSTPIDLQNGEEDEIKLFAQRAKLMIFNPETKKYDSQGVGEMKLLQKKEDKTKIRLLCRSDGMGNILLNTAVVKSFNYTPLVAEKEEMVKTPTVGVDGKLTTYIVRFKQKADGRSFIKSIEDAKKDM